MPDKTETELLYEAREKRFNDAVSLKRPDRVPIVSLTNFFRYSYYHCFCSLVFLYFVRATTRHSEE